MTAPPDPALQPEQQWAVVFTAPASAGGHSQAIEVAKRLEELDLDVRMVRERAQDESADVAAEELIHVVVPPEQAASSTSAGICLTPRVPASTPTRRLVPWSARWCPACRPSARISGSMPASPASVASVSSLMSVAVTRAPAAAKASAAARPMPCPAAVTSAVFPSIQAVIFCLPSGRAALRPHPSSV